MKSMTGFGRSEITIGSQQVSFEVKSVNHRFLDIRVRLPPQFSNWEVTLSEKVKEMFERGSFDVFVRVKWQTGDCTIAGNTRFVVDEKALESFQAASSSLSQRVSLSDSLNLADILRTGKIIIPVEDTPEENLNVDAVLPTWQMALQQLLKMREREGNGLKTTLVKCLLEMEAGLKQLEGLAPLQKEKIREKWSSRLAQWKIEPPLEPHRLEWEIALLTEKSDITEEIDRFSTHIAAAREAFESKVAQGRKIDFLIQEMHREVNTIASKAQLMEITQLTVVLKSNIEKLREQIQNVE